MLVQKFYRQQIDVFVSARSVFEMRFVFNEFWRIKNDKVEGLPAASAFAQLRKDIRFDEFHAAFIKSVFLNQRIGNVECFLRNVHFGN